MYPLFQSAKKNNIKNKFVFLLIIDLVILQMTQMPKYSLIYYSSSISNLDIMVVLTNKSLYEIGRVLFFLDQ